MELCRPANIGENIRRGLAVKARPHSIWAASERIAMAATRYMVEVVVGRIKQYAVMSGPYRGTPEQFDMDANVVPGLVNLKTLWPHIKAAHADTIRKVTAWRGRG